ncbi:DUF6194 family protein [Nakamurella sp.]|uniref:DUF6194 family protein n=1 Tax=Nakamurella sp. TaxID=1869182 RepID=UPI00378387BB
MTIDEITEFIESLGGVLTLRPGPGDGSPELAWGDRFFYYSPAGVLPTGQPFATIVTKDYPDEPAAGLDRPGAFRVNIAAGKDEVRARIGRDPRAPAATAADPGVPDVVAAHPTYGALGWLAVVDPGPATRSDVLTLLRRAHDAARARYERRHLG